jgi:hypothetical protein
VSPRAREACLAVAGFSALTVVLTWPQVQQITSHVGWHYDALFSVWRLAWIAHQLPADPAHLFDANIFYPASNTLTFSDALLLQGLLGAPLIWLGISPITVYNLLVLLSFVTAGVAMYALARSLEASQAGAWVAGTVFAFQPYRFAHYPQLELLWTCWVPLALWALHRAFLTGRVSAGALVGLFVALQALSCLYYAVFLVTGLAIVAIVMGAGRKPTELASLARAGLAALIVTAVIVGPYAFAYLDGRHAIGERSEADVLRWSPTIVNYLAAPFENWLYDPPNVQGIDAMEGMLFPGVAAVLLAGIGALAWHDRGRIAYVVLLLVSVDLSLGLNGFLYRYFFEFVPLYDGLRVPARMFVIVSAAMSVLAAMGVTWLVHASRRRAVRRGFAGGALVAVLAESLSLPVSLRPLPTEAPRTYQWLSEQPPGVVAEWPWPSLAMLGVTDVPRHMYFSTWHWRPLVTGYSGHYPQSFIQLLGRTVGFPDEQAIRELRRIDVRYLILHSHPDPDAYVRMRERLRGFPEFELQFTEHIEGEELALYLLAP